MAAGSWPGLTYRSSGDRDRLGRVDVAGLSPFGVWPWFLRLMMSIL